MFWGMNLKPNRKYSQTIAKSFHISQAALDPEGADDSVHKIYIAGDDNQKYLICTLRKNVCEQVQLDLNFAAGDPICFQTIGSGNVSLSGYLIVPGYFDGGEEQEEEEEDEEGEEAMSSLKALLNGKKADAGQKKKNKKKNKSGEESDEEDESLNAALEESDDDDDEDDEDAEVGEGDEDDSDDDDDEEEDEDDDDDEEEDDDDEDEDEEMKEPKKKVAKIEKKDNKQQQQQQQNGAQKSKKEKKAEKQQQPKAQQQQQQKTGEERTLTGGVKVQDVRVGNGEEVKQGKRAHVYYEGRLKSNNKVFDSLKNGAPFKFTIGRGEVIKAWDVGVAGMKVGGKRRIICPPHMAYGSRGSPPTIPPNSTLVFEVELKSISK